MMAPILCNYYITYRCNARCRFCDIWHHPQFRQVPDCQLSDVINNMKQLTKIGIRFIDFTGGEPLLHPDLPTMVDTAKQLGLYTSVTTNCLLYPTYAKALQGKIDLLHFSLDAIDAGLHNAIRGVPSFDAVMKSIAIAKSLGENPDLLFTVSTANMDQVGRLAQFAASQKLMLLINPVFRYSQQTPLDIHLLDVLDRYSRQPYVYANSALHRLIRRNGNDRYRPRCRAVSSSIVISPDNYLLLPCFHHAYVRLPIRGDLLSLSESPIYQNQRRLQGRHAFCHACTINCYFDPSFLYRVDEYFVLSLLSKVKYAYDKFIRAWLA